MAPVGRCCPSRSSMISTGSATGKNLWPLFGTQGSRRRCASYVASGLIDVPLARPLFTVVRVGRSESPNVPADRQDRYGRLQASEGHLWPSPTFSHEPLTTVAGAPDERHPWTTLPPQA